MIIRFETLAIGDELLTGKIADTNSQFVATKLFEMGFVLQRQTVIADDAQLTQHHVQAMAKRCDYIFCFGGLGPTTDDKTVDAISELLQCKPIDDTASVEKLKERYTALNRKITQEALRQIRYPERCRRIANPVGLAPAFSTKINDCTLFFLPGVPEEMKAIVTESILPEIERETTGRSNIERIGSKIWRCFGVPESELQGLVGEIETKLPKNMWLGFRTRVPENHLVLYWKTNNGKKPSQTAEAINSIQQVVEPFLFSNDDASVEQTVMKLLKQQNQSLAVAESCTGGLVAHRLTSIPGASEHFFGGIVVYQNRAKKILARVELSNPDEAVSLETTQKLARNIRNDAGTTWGLAITGYMGPGGGTEKNPEGTVYIAIDGPTSLGKELRLPKYRARSQKKDAAAAYALYFLAQELRR